jgi:DNA-binding MarR family transcriptional regulator
MLGSMKYDGNPMARATKAPKASKEALAADVWRMMADFAMGFAQRGVVFAELKRMGLTPGHLKVLLSLRSESSLPMGAIADRVGCDPSMATWLIDRLEEQHLAERQMQPTDRRVKAVSLTPAGERLKAELLEQLYQAPDELVRMDAETLANLRRELLKLPPPPYRQSE